MSKDKEYRPKITVRPMTCTKCGGTGKTQAHSGTNVFTETCTKCGGSGYIMITKDLR